MRRHSLPSRSAWVALSVIIGVGCHRGRVAASLDDYSYGLASRVEAMRGFIVPGSEPLALHTVASGTAGGIEVRRAGARDLGAGEGPARALGASLASLLDSVDDTDVRIEELRPSATRPSARIRIEAYGRRGGRPASARATLSLSFERHGSRFEIVSDRLVACELLTSAARRFAERAEEMGVRAVHAQTGDRWKTVALPGIHASPGCALADLDGDGFPDIVIADGGRDHLYLNDQGRSFREANEAAGFKDGGEGRGVLAFDADGDGDLDVLVVNADRDPDLYVNDGRARFMEEGAARGLRGVVEGTMASAADVDDDGQLDVFIACYGDAEKRWPSLTARNGEPDRLFVARDGIYQEMGFEAGVADPGWGLAASFADYDGDGDQDLYVANDFGRNALFRNKTAEGHPLRFDDVTRASGTTDRGFGMSVDWGDADGDGNLDLYVGNYCWDGRFIFRHRDFPMPAFPAPLLRPLIVRRLTAMTRGNSLFLYRGDHRPFLRQSDELHVADAGWAWGSGLFDWDNDGRLDILSLNGWISGRDPTEAAVPFWTEMVTDYDRMRNGGGFVDIGDRSLHGRERERLFVDVAPASDPPRFAEAAYAAGITTSLDGRGLAFGDIDRDGDIDAVISNHEERPLIYMNEGPPDAGFLELDLEGSASGVGARVEVVAGSRRIVRALACGRTFLSTSEPMIHAGLAGWTAPVDLAIAWPDGKRTAHHDVSPGHRYRVREEPSTIEREP